MQPTKLANLEGLGGVSEAQDDGPALRRSDVRELSHLDTALARGRRALEGLQRADGSWEAVTDLGPTGPAMHWIVEHKLGGIAHEDRAEGARYLLAQQRPDGSFLPYPGAAEGTVSATGLCRAGLLACGLEARHPALERASAFIEQQGGYGQVARALMARGDATLLFLIAQGVVGTEHLPRVAPELALTPFDRLIERKLHAGNVMVLLTLCAFNARYAAGVPRGLLASVARRAQNLRIQHYLFAWQNDAGDWNGQACQTWLMLLGLEASGLDKSDPRMMRALNWLRSLYRREPGGLTVNAMNTDVWNTSLALMALCDSGSVPTDAPCSAAIRYLLQAQVTRPMPRVNQRKTGAVRAGGWPFQRGNDTMQDSDDTGLVLAALGRTCGATAPRQVWSAIEQAKRWLYDMQNPDGGFPAFVWNLPSKPPGPMYLTDLVPAGSGILPMVSLLLEPPAELSDPAAEGITGRVLSTPITWSARSLSFGATKIRTAGSAKSLQRTAIRA